MAEAEVQDIVFGQGRVAADTQYQASMETIIDFANTVNSFLLACGEESFEKQRARDIRINKHHLMRILNTDIDLDRPADPLTNSLATVEAPWQPKTRLRQPTGHHLGFYSLTLSVSLSPQLNLYTQGELRPSLVPFGSKSPIVAVKPTSECEAIAVMDVLKNAQTWRAIRNN